MVFYDLVQIIFNHVKKLLDKISDDKLLGISLDKGRDDAVLLKFARYNGINYVCSDTYTMRARIGEGKVIYENAENGDDMRNYIEEYGMTVEEYDEIMSTT